MPRKKIEPKRTRGRPRKGVINVEAERKKACEGIRKSAKQQLGIEDIDINEFREEIYGVTGKHKFTRAEMDTLHRQMDVLYTEFVTEAHAREEEDNKELNAKLKEEALQSTEPLPANAITREEWNQLHGLRPDGKQKPGPKPKKKKTIFDVEFEPGEPIDVEAIEREYLEAKIKEAASEPQLLKGRRVARDRWAARDAQLRHQQHWI